MTTVIKGDSNINLDFSTGGRITGDFSNATVANRVMFKSSSASATTSVGAVPSGDPNAASFIAFGLSDPNNSHFIGLVAPSSGDVRINAGITGTGTYLPMTFYTGGSERMRLDTSGNVGIGTSSPATKLSVVSATNSGISVNDGTVNTIIYNSTGGVSSFGTTTNHPIDFYTNNTARARIDSSGNLLVGTTTVSAKCTVTSNSGSDIYAAITSNPITGYLYNSGSTTTSSFAYMIKNGANVGSINCTTSATSYATSSDYRLKNSIAPMTGALEKVALLKPCTYKWNVDGSDGEGFIAHELAEVCPQAVSGEKDAVNEDGSIKPQGIDTSFLVATLTAAIQEQQAIITALTARVEALEGTQP